MTKRASRRSQKGTVRRGKEKGIAGKASSKNQWQREETLILTRFGKAERHWGLDSSKMCAKRTKKSPLGRWGETAFSPTGTSKEKGGVRKEIK